MRWCLAAITWFCLTACTTVKPNSEQPIFGKHIYYYYQWADYCKRNPQDVDCRGLKWQLIKPSCTSTKQEPDTTTTTTTAGLVHRQVISLADPESNNMRV